MKCKGQGLLKKKHGQKTHRQSSIECIIVCKSQSIDSYYIISKDDVPAKKENSLTILAINKRKK